ncbi:hypothetical protein [Cupriavidus sp. YAF13]|uniref:hypothetical protein n=1 Tax=Cupriavidus sp. YAF13 TaxID=3233075 RepID=UPI003F8EF6B4
MPSLSWVCPQHTPDDWQEEVSVRSDRLQIAFRKTLKALEARGWEVDPARRGQRVRGAQGLRDSLPGTA